MRFPQMLAGSAVVLALGTAHARAQKAPAENRFEQAIGRFEAADRENPPAAGGVLFLGSSSIRLWDLAETFPELDALNRGFGGSQIADSIHFIHRIAINYKPRTIVFYAGDNDIAAGKTPQQVANDFVTFAQLVHEELPDTQILFIAIKPSLARWQLADKMRQANLMIQVHADIDPKITYVDVFEPMLDDSGKPDKDLFIADGLHLNSAGYKLWAAQLEPLLAGKVEQ